jgi:hypothetical protein
MTGGMLQRFYFNKCGDGRWMVYDQHGSGDMILEPGDIDTQVIRDMLPDACCETGENVYHFPAVIDTSGWGKLELTLRLYVLDGVLTRAKLMTTHGRTEIDKDLKRFTLPLPGLNLKPWPYPESDTPD